MQSVVNKQEEGVTGHISREFHSILIQATPDCNTSGSVFLPKTNCHPLSAWNTFITASALLNIIFSKVNSLEMCPVTP